MLFDEPTSALDPEMAGDVQIKQAVLRSSPFHAVLRASSLKSVVYQGFQGSLGMKYEDVQFWTRDGKTLTLYAKAATDNLTGTKLKEIRRALEE